MKLSSSGIAVAAVAVILAGCGGGSTGNGGGGGGACSNPKGGAPSGTTAAQTVQVVSDPNTIGAYKPSTINVKVGDSVEWDWTDQSSQHSVTADDGSFDSCLQSAGAKFTVTFSQAGDYKYHCTIHASMLGDVKVS